MGAVRKWFMERGAQGVIGEAEICNAQDPGSRAREGHLLFYPWRWGAPLCRIRTEEKCALGAIRGEIVGGVQAPLA